MEQLKDRVAVVTGGASGIGHGMARAFAAEGMRIVVADIEAKPLQEAVDGLRESGASAIGVACDVSDPAAVDALRDEALAEYGAVHVLCNNAGVGGSSPGAIWEADADEWRWVMGVNLHGVVHGIRAFVPAMLAQAEGGHVVNTASMAGLVSGGGIYGVTKHGVVALSESMHRDAAMRGLRLGVSVLCPGWVNTRILESERNRPEAPRESEAVDPQMQMMRDVVAGFVASGLEPLEVGRLVADAIRSKRFYVLTHPTWKNMIRHRMENILEDRDPTSVGPEGEDWLAQLTGQDAASGPDGDA